MKTSRAPRSSQRRRPAGRKKVTTHSRTQQGQLLRLETEHVSFMANSAGRLVLNKSGQQPLVAPFGSIDTQMSQQAEWTRCPSRHFVSFCRRPIGTVDSLKSVDRPSTTTTVDMEEEKRGTRKKKSLFFIFIFYQGPAVGRKINQE